LTLAWVELARAVTPTGDVLALRRREAEFEIRFNGWELITSRNSVSETALAHVVCARIDCTAPRILIGGLGMGYTLRAVLDRVGGDARITVAELVPDVISWNLGPLAELANRPLEDDRVLVHGSDVGEIFAANRHGFDAVLMDVDNGPEAVLYSPNHAFYSMAGLACIVGSLRPGGLLGLWSADRSPAFERVVDASGLDAERVDIAIRGCRQDPTHTIYLVRAG
jgi:spermidine synthase